MNQRTAAAGAMCLLLAGTMLAGDAIRRLQPDRGHYVLRFPRPLEPGDAGWLAARDSRIVAWLAEDAVVISAPDRAEWDGLAPTRLAAASKISPAAAESAGAWLVEFHPDVDREAARALVRGAGLDILEHPDLLARQLLVAGPWERIASLAEWDEVSYIFPAAEDLVLGNPVVACAGAMTEFGPAAQYVSVGRGWPGAGPQGLELHYFFAGITARLPRSTVESEMIRAMEEWAKHANLRFTPAGESAAARTISILFARGAHGDGASFDGPGKVLAHTYYPAPPNREPIAGDMHLDDGENWQVGSGIDLYTVALHEAGHALGLGHSDRPGAVMYPYYRLSTGLGADDIAGIRALYGARETTTPPPPAGVSLAILEPASPAVTTAAASMAIAGTAANAVGVEWRSDRGPSGNASGTARWTVAAAPLSPGPNVITMTAADAAGNTASRAVTITRQETPAPPPPPAGNGAAPALRITSPAFTILSTSQPAVALRGTASSAAGIAVVKWSNAAGGSGEAVGTTNWTAAGVPLLVGTNTITVRAYDPAGNSAWRAVTVVRR